MFISLVQVGRVYCFLNSGYLNGLKRAPSSFFSSQAFDYPNCIKKGKTPNHDDFNCNDDKGWFEKQGCMGCPPEKQHLGKYETKKQHASKVSGIEDKSLRFQFSASKTRANPEVPTLSGMCSSRKGKN
jgi:hypothetical protein